VEYVVLNILAGIMLVILRKEMSELAKHYGADEFYTPESVPEKYILMDYKGENGVDIVIECTGKEEALILKKNQMDI
jgi:threonine dehydrogenase-like Zn-dependent dehydrogenase